MALIVNTNITSLNALNNLSSSTMRLENTFERVSSGLRINSAADDAAGLAVAENLDATTRSLRQASRNANDGISVIQTAEGATNEVANILKRMRELAVQSASGTLAATERTYIEDEYLQLTAEVDRIASVTNFNGVPLADGGNGTISVQVGVLNDANNRIDISLADLSASTLGINTGAMSLSTATAARNALTIIDTALDSVNSYRSVFGATQNRLESALRNLSTYTENLTAAESRIRDADYALEAAAIAKYQTMQQAGVSVLAQANQLSQGALRLLQ